MSSVNGRRELTLVGPNPSARPSRQQCHRWGPAPRLEPDPLASVALPDRGAHVDNNTALANQRPRQAGARRGRHSGPHSAACSQAWFAPTVPSAPTLSPCVPGKPCAPRPGQARGVGEGRGLNGHPEAPSHFAAVGTVSSRSRTPRADEATRLRGGCHPLSAWLQMIGGPGQAGSADHQDPHRGWWRRLRREASAMRAASVG